MIWFMALDLLVLLCFAGMLVATYLLATGLRRVVDERHRVHRLRDHRLDRGHLSARRPGRPGALLMVLDIVAVVITYAAVGVAAWFLGGYMLKVYRGERVWLSRVVRPIERFTYK